MKATPHVLILTAPYGAGHDRVAAALAQAVVAEGARAEVLDHFGHFVPRPFARASVALFWAVLRYAPPLWAAAYRIAAGLDTRSPAMLGMGRLGARALGRHLAATRPDVVAHAHPTPAGALAWLRARGATCVPHAIVLTDFVAHGQWTPPHVDRYFVPADEIAEALVGRGVPADRVLASGVPIDAAFSGPVDRASLRAELHLDPGVATVLLMSGMHGWLGGIAEVAELLATLAVPFQAVVVCGRHATLADRLRARLAGDRRFRVLGWVPAVHRVMGAVDLVVTKAGAVTCAEALALERPLVFYRSVPGQERHNETFLERCGAALVARDRATLLGHVALLVTAPGRRAELAAAARRLRRPEAARTVAKELLALAGGR